MFVAVCKRQTLRAVPGPGKTLPFVIFAEFNYKTKGWLILHRSPHAIGPKEFQSSSPSIHNLNASRACAIHCGNVDRQLSTFVVFWFLPFPKFAKCQRPGKIVYFPFYRLPLPSFREIESISLIMDSDGLPMIGSGVDYSQVQYLATFCLNVSAEIS